MKKMNGTPPTFVIDLPLFSSTLKTTVDAADYEWMKKEGFCKWMLSNSGHVFTWKGKKIIYLHRLVTLICLASKLWITLTEILSIIPRQISEKPPDHNNNTIPGSKEKPEDKVEP